VEERVAIRLFLVVKVLPWELGECKGMDPKKATSKMGVREWKLLVQNMSTHGRHFAFPHAMWKLQIKLKIKIKMPQDYATLS